MTGLEHAAGGFAPAQSLASKCALPPGDLSQLERKSALSLQPGLKRVWGRFRQYARAPASELS